MRVIEDETADARYIYLGNQRPSSTRQIAQGTIVDLDDDDQLIGIEIVCLHRAWRLEDILATYNVSGEDAAQLRQLAGVV